MVYIFENEKKVQKNRGSRLPKKLKLKYGNSAYYVNEENRIELVHLIFLKKRIKRFFPKRETKIEYVRERVWFYITPNFKIQQKSKNSRMGKGKGLIERHTIRVRKNTLLFEFVGVNNILLKKVLHTLNKKLTVKLNFIFLSSNNYIFWSSNNQIYSYYGRYAINY